MQGKKKVKAENRKVHLDFHKKAHSSASWPKILEKIGHGTMTKGLDRAL